MNKIIPPEFSRLIKINPDTDCWEWIGRRTLQGYGVILKERAHRVFYYLFNGEIHAGPNWVCHHCDNPPCCNPDHLYIGTCKTNWDDCWSRGRANKEKGANRYNAKLNDSKVIEILHLLQHGSSVQSVSKSTGVSRMAIYHIAYGTRWRHIKRPDGFEFSPKFHRAGRSSIDRELNRKISP